MSDPANWSAFDLLCEAYDAADGATRRSGHWLMDRAWYDKIRAAVPSEQDKKRAAAHAYAVIAANATPPLTCPACPSRPFASMQELAGHITLMADPDYREPNIQDLIFGLPVEVREGAGKPRLTRLGPDPRYPRHDLPGCRLGDPRCFPARRVPRVAALPRADPA